MDISDDELLSKVAELPLKVELKDNLRETRKAMGITAVFTGIFAFLGGPIGIPIGAIIGGGTAYWNANAFRSFAGILYEDLTKEQQSELCTVIRGSIDRDFLLNAVTFGAALTADPTLGNAIIEIVIRLLSSQQNVPYRVSNGIRSYAPKRRFWW